MKVITILFAAMLLSSAFVQTDSVTGIIIKKVIKPVIRKIKNVANTVINHAATSIAIDEAHIQTKKWIDKVSKTSSAIPKPSAWCERITNEKKHNTTGYKCKAPRMP
ncbi:MAG: hypothetical protein Gaeavirus14_19 [Gaeavirus sp.]|uniref:Uncharacterized protein n=1 Tax=Gaeavirus sp. TaxID=2487767 RepID=A0A3G4ZZ67_9VIRU|nr:MAG: hypothetical protein Gaeavirus14_2 [Gaeavirus sp.]AYV80189.1 MAG: hypothetical protein Gaeavirus14_19 [Gaeavirus sp.]